MYPYNMAFRVQILIDGVEQTTSDIEVAAFNGSICTNSSRVKSFTSSNYYRANMTIKGESAYAITFKLYNHATEEELLYYTLTSPEGTQLDGINWAQGTASTYANPYVLNFQHTNTLPIAHYANANDGWYLIASPLAAATAPTSVGSMTSNNYDLFYFDQTKEKEWVNYKENEGNVGANFDLVPGKGYLYANSNDVILQFVGAPYNNDNLQVTLVSDASSPHLKGWNLIGNSYTTPKSLSGISYYRMNPETHADLIAGTGNIAGMEGVFVYTETDGQVIGFGAPSTKRADEENRVALNLLNNENKTLDRIIVGFDERTELPKYYMKESTTVIYVSQPDRDYAVVQGSATNVFPVSFKTEHFGTYTLSADLGGASVSYMHLIDKVTGADVDMLLEGEYSFIGAPVDRTDRFILRLGYSGNFKDDDNNFAYQNGTDLVVCGEGTLQVFDIMGRFVNSQEIHGVQTIPALPSGVYIFRMVGEEIQTQKIYVR